MSQHATICVHSCAPKHEPQGVALAAVSNPAEAVERAVLGTSWMRGGGDKHLAALTVLTMDKKQEPCECEAMPYARPRNEVGSREQDTGETETNTGGERERGRCHRRLTCNP